MHGRARAAILVAGAWLTLGVTTITRADNTLGFAVSTTRPPLAGQQSAPPSTASEVQPIVKSPAVNAPAPPPAPEPAPVMTTPAASGRVKWEIIGRSVENRVIECAQFGSGEYQVLVVGSLVGNEPEGSGVAEMLAENLARFPRRVENVTVTIVRDPNPDGHARRTAGNANGVLINRNFLTSSWRQWSDGDKVNSGHQAETEAESRAITELVNDVKPHRVIILSTSKDTPTVRFTGPAEHLAQQVAIEAKAKLVPNDPAQASGSLATMTGTDRAIPTLVMGFVPRATADTIFSEHKSALMTAIGCGSPVGFSPTAPPANTVTAAPPFTRPMTPVSGKRAVEELEVAPIPFDAIVRGQPTVPIAQPTSGAIVATPTPAPKPSQSSTPATTVTHAKPVDPAPSNERLERLPPLNMSNSGNSKSSDGAMPQPPIPTYPTTGLD